MTDPQRQEVQKFFSYVNIKKFAEKYYKHWSYTYLAGYVNGNRKRTRQMDAKLQTMILDFHDDTFEIIENITKVENVQ